MNVFLFGGTTEGRKIAEAIAEVNRAWVEKTATPRGEAALQEAPRKGVQEHVVSAKFQYRKAQVVEPSGLPICAEVYVATAYGASLLPAGPGITVHVGRLDAAEMRALFEAARQTSAPLLVVDATHPYAAVVSENILAACAAAGLRCIRVERESTGAEGNLTSPEGAALHWVDSIEEAAAWLVHETSDAKCMPATSDMKTQVPGLRENRKERTQAAQAAIGNDAQEDPDRPSSEASHRPNILITTGSKELAPYTRIPDFAARCYVRALPTVEALEKCRQLGFRREHLILMQGPFSEEMNVAQLRYADAGYLVTKASGETGGFPEKCEAALALGVEVVCIGRPKEVSIPDAAWYDREKLDAVLRRIREIGSTGTCESSSEDAVATCGSSTTESSEE